MPAPNKVAAPMMKTLGRGVIVQKPFAELDRPVVGPMGGISVGAHHIETVGPVLSIAFHSRDGETLVATLGAEAYAWLSVAMNEAGDRIVRGDYNEPERKQ